MRLWRTDWMRAALLADAVWSFPYEEGISSSENAPYASRAAPCTIVAITRRDVLADRRRRLGFTSAVDLRRLSVCDARLHLALARVSLQKASDMALQIS